MDDDTWKRQGFVGRPWPAPQSIIDAAKKQGVEICGKPFKILDMEFVFVRP